MNRRFVIPILIAFLSSCSSDERSVENYLEMELVTAGKSFDTQGRQVDSFQLRNDSIVYECYSRKGKQGSSDENILYVDFRIRQLKDESDFFKAFFKNETDRQSVLEEFQFRGVDKFELVTATDTIAPHIYHFETSHGLSPFVTFLLGFDLAELNESNYELNFGHPKFEGGKKIKVKL